MAGKPYQVLGLDTTAAGAVSGGVGGVHEKDPHRKPALLRGFGRGGRLLE
jgi:hypothetical protein